MRDLDNWKYQGEIVLGTLEELEDNLIDCSRCGSRYLIRPDPWNNVRFFADTHGYLCYYCYHRAKDCRKCGQELAMREGLCRNCYMGEDQFDIKTLVYHKNFHCWDEVSKPEEAK